MVDERITEALQTARMYYYQSMTTEAIARELHVSRSKVSRLLQFARDQGLVQIQILDPDEKSYLLEEQIKNRFNLNVVRVIQMPDTLPRDDRLARVAQFAASYLNTCVESHMIIGVAWDHTISTVINHLTPKAVNGVQIVQMNGAGNTHSPHKRSAAADLIHLAHNYQAQTHLLPVPAFFDRRETRACLWHEQSVQQVLDMQQEASILLFSIGAMYEKLTGNMYRGEYLTDDDYECLKTESVVGDIATVMFREDGSYADIDLNARASGPDLALFRRVYCSICVVVGEQKLRGLQAALRGGYLNHLIIDEPTARLLIQQTAPL